MSALEDKLKDIGGTIKSAAKSYLNYSYNWGYKTGKTSGFSSNLIIASFAESLFYGFTLGVSSTPILGPVNNGFVWVGAGMSVLVTRFIQYGLGVVDRTLKDEYRAKNGVHI